MIETSSFQLRKIFIIVAASLIPVLAHGKDIDWGKGDKGRSGTMMTKAAEAKRVIPEFPVFQSQAQCGYYCLLSGPFCFSQPDSSSSRKRPNRKGQLRAPPVPQLILTHPHGQWLR